jgi:hypothetical protein
VLIGKSGYKQISKRHRSVDMEIVPHLSIFPAAKQIYYLILGVFLFNAYVRSNLMKKIHINSGRVVLGNLDNFEGETFAPTASKRF